MTRAKNPRVGEDGVSWDRPENHIPPRLSGRVVRIENRVNPPKEAVHSVVPLGEDLETNAKVVFEIV